jgi:hypothetical protein
MIPLVLNTQNGKSMDTESGLVVSRGWKEGEMKSDCLMGLGFLFRMIKMF